LGLTVFNNTQISDYTKYYADIKLIGVTAVLILLAGILSFGLNRDLLKTGKMALLFITVLSFSLLIASPLSNILWQFLPVNFIQFPFRMLSLTVLAGAFLSAFILAQMKFKYKVVCGIILVIATAISSSEYILVKDVNTADDTFYSTNEATTTVHDEYMPLWVLEKPTEHFMNKVEVVSGAGEISNLFTSSKEIAFDYISDSPSIIQINTIYYPGWKALSGNQEKAIFYDNDRGLMQLKVKEGRQRIKVFFTETPFRAAADAISLIGLFLLLLFSYKKVIFEKLKLKL
jgi:hypothetical protein